MKQKHLIAIPIPNDEKRRYLGNFCSDENVVYQLTRLGLYGKDSAKPFLNFHSKGICSGVIYNVELEEGEYEIIGESKMESGDRFVILKLADKK